MSNFREKAREVKSAGEAQRGNFAPQGAPKRVYEYWLNNSSSKKARGVLYGGEKENFCHFWRVVAIWAPLLFVGTKVGNFLTSTPGGLLAAGLLIAAVVFGATQSVDFLQVVIAMLGVLALGAVIIGTGAGVEWAVNKYADDPEKTLEKIVVGLFVTVISAAGIALLTVLAIDIGWLLLWIALGLAAVAVLVYFSLGHISDFLQGMRERDEAAQEERTQKILSGEIVLKEKKERKPSKVGVFLSNFFKGLGDFVILAAQVIRVNKWKICPLVEVDTKEQYQ